MKSLRVLAAGLGLATVAAVSGAVPAIAGGTYEATTTDNNVAIRSCAHVRCTARGFMEISGSVFFVYCYVRGDYVHGDNVWYSGGYQPTNTKGYTSGYYLDTGHDPRPGISHC